MWRLLSLLWVLTTANGQVSFDPEEFRKMLHEAAEDVLRQHAYEMANLAPVPRFNEQGGFMRSFLPNTGVLNRDELVIESIRGVEVYSDRALSRLLLQRHNSTDYALGLRGEGVALARADLSVSDYFVYTEDNLVLKFSADRWSRVKDACLFTRSHRSHAPLSMAVLTESTKGSVLSVYEVHGNEALVVGVIEFVANSAKKIIYAQSELGGSLVVLVDLPPGEAPKLVYRHKGNDEPNNFLEVHYPAAVDMVTFTIHGRAYVAVANATDCDIYKIDLFLRNHTQFDRLVIPAGDFTNMEYFRLGFYHFLALSGTNEQYFYTWTSGQFSLGQVLTVPNAVQLYAVSLPTCRDDVVIFIVHRGGTAVYIYDGRTESFVPSDVAVPADFRVAPNSLASFVVDKKAVLVFLDPSGHLRAFVVHTRLVSLADPVIAAGKRMTKEMEDIQEMLSNQNRQIREIRQVLSNAVRPTGDQVISAPQGFQNLRSSAGIVVQEFVEPVFVEWDGAELTLDQYKEGTQVLEQSILDLERMVEDIEHRIADVVRIDQPANITGRKTFTGQVIGSSVKALSVNLENAGGINIPQLQKEVYRLDRPQPIKGTLTFEKPLKINNLHTDGTIGDLRIANIMTTNTEQISRARMIFDELKVNGNLDVSGTVNGIDVSEEVVTLHGSHRITGKKVFSRGVVAENANIGELDGINVDEMYRRALTKSGEQTLTGKTVFNSLTTKNIILHGLFNGYNITTLADSIVRVDKPANIIGHKTFNNSLTLESSCYVKGLVNNLRIPEDLFLNNVEDQTLSNKEFTGTVTADHVEVSGTIDGLRIPEDIVTLTGDEEINGTVYFADGIYVEGDIEVTGLVDGVDISEVAKEAVKVNETSQFENAVFMGPVTIAGNLEVQGTINDVNLKELVPDIVFKDEEEVEIDSEKTFQTLVSDSVKLDGTINGFNIEVDFMKVNGDQVINGTKIFKDRVTFNSITVADGMIGGLNVTQLHENKVTLIIEDEKENLDFVDQVVVEGDLTVHGRIGGLRIPEDVVLKDSNQTISNKVFTDVVKVKHLFVDGDAHVSGLFGGVDLNQFDKDRLSLTRNQTIQGDLWLDDSRVKNLELSDGIDGVDIREFASNVLLKTGDQVITGEKTFLGETVVVGPITTSSGVNGVDIRDLNSRAFKLQSEDGNLVTEPLDFQDMTIRDLKVIGYVNSVNLTHLAENSLKKNSSETQYVSGETVFERGFHVDGDVLARTVNGLVLEKDVLLKSIPQTINGQFTIANMTVSADLNVTGTINGLDLSDAYARLLTSEGDPVLYSDVTFAGPVHVSGDVQVSGLVNDLDLPRLSEDVLLRDGDQVIRGRKVLRGAVTIDGDVDVKYVNGIDWHEFVDDVVRIDVPQVILSRKVFVNEVKAKYVHAESPSVGLINGRTLQTLIDDAVFVDVPAVITGRKTFEGDVEIKGDLNADLINGLNLKDDVITLMCNDKAPQVITGQKNFSNLVSHADLMVAGTVNSHNLLELYRDTLLVVGDQNVTGHKYIQEEVVFKQNVHSDTVNGMKLKTDLVTLDTDQTLDGDYVFNGNVILEEDLFVDGLINGVNITELAAEAVYLHTPQRIDGEYVMDSVVAMEDVAVHGLVNGIDLPALDRNVSEFVADARLAVRELEQHTQEVCDTARRVQDVLAKSFYVLDGFIVHQELIDSASFVEESSQRLTLVKSGDVSNATSYTWSPVDRKFVAAGQVVNTQIAKKLFHTIGNVHIVIHVGINHKDSFVTINDQTWNLPVGFLDAAVTRLGADSALVALLFEERAFCEFFLVNLPPAGLPSVESYGAANVGKDTTAIALFEVKGLPYLAISRYQFPPHQRGFCKIFGLVNGSWQRVQTIAIFASTFVGHFFENSRHHLVFSNVAPVHETREPKSIHIYRNLSPTEAVFTLFQKIVFDNAAGVETFRFGDLSNLHLAAWNDTAVQVFQMEGESGFRETFLLRGQCIRDVKSFEISGDLYLAVGQQDLKTNTQLPSVVFKGLVKGVRYIPRIFTYC